ncbi:flagellar motor protein MotB [Halomonas sp. GD1P12]|uniref:OmpA/MotB family protein n=1 Tax=Halomonas sp. GD1P12 TaxID=2982691 RepID=UPI0021E45B3D|nr:OmpA family protein [Halomonas sp. GD1P12]UYG00090.1 OmpA family protein [Halomonas sp. GD1P12]
MLNCDARHALESPFTGGEGEEGWLTSYLDVLTLLITLFVLLLALTPAGSGGEASNEGQGLQPLSSGILPRDSGLSPAMAALDIQGVSVSQGREGVTLRIDDSLLFASGAAELTPQGEGVLERLSEVIDTFEGEVSVEGHTDNVPISTAAFASNWELSTGRAIAVVRHLEQEGVARQRLRAVGYADTRPLAGNDTREGRAANRRVEFVLRTPAPEPARVTP